MSKKLTWLDKFAEEQAKKIEKTASKKVAEQIIVDSDEVPEAKTGASITYKNATYKVVDANYKDEIGAGIVLEKLAEDANCPECTNGQPGQPGQPEQPGQPGQPCVKCGVTPCVCPQVTASIDEEAVDPAITPAPEMGAPVQKKVTDAPEMARTNPGDAYHIEVRDTTEVQGFESAANETASNIAAENAIDGTTPEGKVNRILQRMQAPMTVAPTTEEVSVVDEEVVDEEVVDEVTVVDEVPVELEKEEVEENETSEEEVTEEADEEKKDKLANNRIFKKIIAKLQ